MTTELKSAAASAIRLVILILHSTKLRQAVARKSQRPAATCHCRSVARIRFNDAFQPASLHRLKPLERRTKRLLETLADLGAGGRIRLRTLMFDLQRAHQAGETARVCPAQLVLDAIQQATAECVAATGWIDDFMSLHGRNFFDAFSVQNLRR